MKTNKLKTSATPLKLGGHPRNLLRMRNTAQATGKSRGPIIRRTLADGRPTPREILEANATCPYAAPL